MAGTSTLRRWPEWSRWLAAALLATQLGGCAATQPEAGTAPPARQLAPEQQAFANRQFAVSDPLAGTNKQIYKFNAKFDQYVFLPAIDAYEAVTPEFLRDRVTYFFANVGEFGNFTNATLQGSGTKAATTLGRFLVNTTVGLLGTFDVASRWGLQRQPEDFGQTLGTWGVGDGPYLVLPVLGPSNLRDVAGAVFDIVTLSLVIPNDIENETAYKIVAYGVRPLDARYRNDFRYFHSGSAFEYEFVRYIRKNARDLEIRK